MQLATREALTWWVQRKAKPRLDELHARATTLDQERAKVETELQDLVRRIGEVESDLRGE